MDQKYTDPTLTPDPSSIAQHRRGKGLVAFPADDVSFPL